MGWFGDKWNDFKEWAGDNVPGVNRRLFHTSGEGWKIQYYLWGVVITLDHPRACFVVNALMIGSLGAATHTTVGMGTEAALLPFPSNVIVAGAIHTHAWAIKTKNDNSGGKGVKIYATWITTGNVTTPTVYNISRRGEGWSPCDPDFASLLWTDRLRSDEYEWLAAQEIHLP